jgi:hypothetical protein
VSVPVNIVIAALLTWFSGSSARPIEIIRSNLEIWFEIAHCISTFLIHGPLVRLPISRFDLPRGYNEAFAFLIRTTDSRLLRSYAQDVDTSTVELKV